MDTQLDLSIAATIKDPALRASLERLGAVMKDTRRAQSRSRRPQPRSSSSRSFPKPRGPFRTRWRALPCFPASKARTVASSRTHGWRRLPTEIRFDGEQLNQDDHDLLMQMVFMAQNKPLGSWVMVPSYAILQALGRQIGGKQYRELRADILRLARAMVIIRNTETKREMFGHRLIAKAELDEKTRHWIYRLDPDLHELYGDITHTLIDWDQRLALKGKDLARWLQLYLASHARRSR